MSLQTGTIMRACEIGHKGTNKWIWQPCIDCGKERWTFLLRGKPDNLRCSSCANRKTMTGRTGERHTAWKGGTWVDTSGYVVTHVSLHDDYAKMANIKGYILEHRLIMAKHIGRCLLPKELVHHLNGVKTDNRVENLFLITNKEHNQVIEGFQKRIRELEFKLTMKEV